MMKRFIIGMLMSWTACLMHAQQWTAKDSLNLKRILNGKEDVKLNMDAVNQIDFGNSTGTPRMSSEKNWMLPDLTLPEVLPEQKKLILTLRPYTAHTRFDWDPVNQKKIKVGKDTWRNEPLRELYMQFKYSNWAKTPMDGGGGYRRSLEEIEATGLRYNPLSGRANNMAVGAWEGVGGPTGNDFMTPFTKDFWDIKGRKRRARTLEVLKSYGDSVTVNVPGGVLQPIVQ